MLQAKVELVLERSVSFRLSQMKMVRELGFDSSRETYIKGYDSIVIMLELTKEYYLIIFMEMAPLKVDFFDCE